MDFIFQFLRYINILTSSIKMSKSFQNLINHLVFQNQEIYITIDQWSETLTYQEFSQFKKDQQKNSLLWKEYQDSGIVIVKPIKKEITVQIFDYDNSRNITRTVQMKVGEEIFLAENVTQEQVKNDPDFDFWKKRYDKEFKKLALEKIKKNEN